MLKIERERTQLLQNELREKNENLLELQSMHRKLQAEFEALKLKEEQSARKLKRILRELARQGIDIKEPEPSDQELESGGEVEEAKKVSDK